MRIKILTIAGQTMNVTVSEQSEAAMGAFLASGDVPENWIAVTDTDSGWAARINLAQCVRVEKAAT